MISRFYLKSPAQRRDALTESGASPQVVDAMLRRDDIIILDKMSENVIGAWHLPLGILTGLVVDGREHRVAMATEEPSVVAAACRAARLFNLSGGVHTTSCPPVTTAQIMIGIDPGAAAAFCRTIADTESRWLDVANRCDPALTAAGGGAFELTARPLPAEPESREQLVSASLRVHTCDAMGANAVNTMAEAILELWCHEFSDLPGFERGMAIVSNDGSGRMVHAEITLHPAEIEKAAGLRADLFMAKMARATRFAQADPQRAVTHNKGILNGITAAAVPLGQDTRALAAAAFHHACQSGKHQPLALWTAAENGLTGTADIPVPCGFAGGARKYPPADAAFRFDDIRSGRELAALLAAVGLAQNCAALWALITDGIQAGHMALHRRKNA